MNHNPPMRLSLDSAARFALDAIDRYFANDDNDTDQYAHDPDYVLRDVFDLLRSALPDWPDDDADDMLVSATEDTDDDEIDDPV